MRLNPRYFPALIVAAFFIFLFLGLVLGFGPERSGAGRHGALLILGSIA